VNATVLLQSYVQLMQLIICTFRNKMYTVHFKYVHD